MNEFLEALSRAHADRHHSFVAVAVEDTAPLTAEKSGTRGLLQNLPFAVKDNIDAAGFPTIANTPALLGGKLARDSTVVARLRAAGAGLVGKTNTHELALGITTSQAVFPATLHPNDASRSPGGSSGGAAVAVAAGIVPFALGTDTGGSLSIPASWCGVYGFRPTTGRWPSDGVVPLSPTRDTVGIVAATATLLERVDLAVCGGRATTTSNATSSPVRLGIPLLHSEYTNGLDPDVRMVWEAALVRLRDSGLVEFVAVDTSALHRLEASCGKEIEFFEISHALTAYLARRPRGLTFEGLLRQTARSDVGDLLAESLRFARRETEYENALSRRSRLQAAYAQIASENEVVALLYPSVARVAPIVTGPGSQSDQEIFSWGTRSVNPGSVAGQPVISMPSGRTEDGLPVGISLEGRRFDDRALIKLAQWLAPVLHEF